MNLYWRPASNRFMKLVDFRNVNHNSDVSSEYQMYSGRTEKNMKETKSLNTFIQNRIVESSRGQQSLCWPKKLKSLPIKF